MSEQSLVAWIVTDEDPPNAWCYVMAVDEPGAIAEAMRIDPSGEAITEYGNIATRIEKYDAGITESQLFRDGRMWTYCSHCECDVRCDEPSNNCLDAIPEDADDDADDVCYPVIGERGAIYCCESCWQESGETKRDGDSPVLVDGICLFADV